MRSIFTKTVILMMWILVFVFTVKILSKNNFFSNEENIIHIFTYPEQFTDEVLDTFEKETGIKVIVHNFTNNEELIAKIKRTKGTGFDLVTPSDYGVQILREQNLLQKLDKSKLNFLKHLDPFLLNRSYDPNNTYSMPYDWEIFGFGMEKSLLENQNSAPSWDLIFDSKSKVPIVMVNDPIEALSFASFYLHGKKRALSNEEIIATKNLLISQKTRIEAYAAIREDYFLLSENCKAAIASSSYLLKAVETKPSLSFRLPKEGTFIQIETIAIPASSKKQDLVYQFINFIYQPQYQAAESAHFFTFPARLDVLESVDTSEEYKRTLSEARKKQYNIYTLDDLMPEHKARKTWVEIKSS